MNRDRCSLCRNQADMAYFDFRICSECFGKHAPAKLDRRLGIKGQNHSFEISKSGEVAS